MSHGGRGWYLILSGTELIRSNRSSRKETGSTGSLAQGGGGVFCSFLFLPPSPRGPFRSLETSEQPARARRAAAISQQQGRAMHKATARMRGALLSALLPSSPPPCTSLARKRSATLRSRKREGAASEGGCSTGVGRFLVSQFQRAEWAMADETTLWDDGYPPARAFHC
jgi:hypothetical protein